MIARFVYLIALFLVLPGPGWDFSLSARAGDPGELVDQYLQMRGASGYTISAVTEDYVANTFADIAFFGVRFRQYPVPSPPPEGLAFSNVFFVVDRDVYYMTNADDLHDFFFIELGPVENEDAALNAGRTWLRLSEDFSQDGFFQFSKPTVSFAKGVVSGDVTVENGGRGSIHVAMTFDKNGQVTDIQESRKVFTGIRPICQATKLLDSDSLVRRMAAQDILVMGSLAKEYLDEQRTKAKPQLQKAIDRIWKKIQEEGR
jgi:hypothetical protein